MFERYTEKARRTIFFARYEASQVGSPYIETEHLLLGVLREDLALAARFLHETDINCLREQVLADRPRHQKASATVDLPLTNECKLALAQGMEEADRMQHPHIGTGHLFVGVLLQADTAAEKFLKARGLTVESAREYIASRAPEAFLQLTAHSTRGEPVSRVMIHGEPRELREVRRRVALCRQFHWEKKTWAAVDIVRHRGHETVSFDLMLLGNSPEMELVKGGWKKDTCAVCLWVLSDQMGPEHATGYTNGRDWICEECYEKFWARADSFSGGFEALT